jgi:hypothetical protein
MGVSKVDSGIRARSRAMQAHGAVVAGLAVALLAIPPPVPAQVPGLAAIGPILRWTGERIAAAAAELTVVEGAKKLLGVGECKQCEEKLAAIQDELDRQVKAEALANTVLTNELQGVRAELDTLKALREGRLADAKSDYEESARLLAMVPALHDEIVGVRAEVGVFREYVEARMNGLDDRVKELQNELQVANNRLDELIRQAQANASSNGGRGGAVTPAPTQSYPYPQTYPYPQWPAPVVAVPPVLPNPRPGWLPARPAAWAPRVCVRRIVLVRDVYGRVSQRSACFFAY